MHGRIVEGERKLPRQLKFLEVMASVNALPERGSGWTAGPGEGHILGPFDSKDAAIEGGKRYIDEKQRRRKK